MTFVGPSFKSYLLRHTSLPMLHNAKWGLNLDAFLAAMIGFHVVQYLLLSTTPTAGETAPYGEPAND